MDAIYADLSISMSEFKKNPSQILRTAGARPVAVLSHNRPAFYMISPSVYEALIDSADDRDLVNIARQRLALKDTAVEVNIDEI
jgi:antitoxin StbD